VEFHSGVLRTGTFIVAVVTNKIARDIKVGGCYIPLDPTRTIELDDIVSDGVTASDFWNRLISAFVVPPTGRLIATFNTQIQTIACLNVLL